MIDRATTPVVGEAPRIGLLFDFDWDAAAHTRLDGPLSFDRQGFDLLSFFGGLRLLAIDLDRYADRIAQHGRASGWKAVVSHHELYGALVAAMVAERLGLAGPTVQAVLACQHKHYARQVLNTVCPEANVSFRVVDPARDATPGQPPGFPVYVKPVRATFSVLARIIDSHASWSRFFGSVVADRWITSRLLRPFEQAITRHLPSAGSAMRFLVEEPIWSPQYNLDGYVDGEGIHLLGVVDAVSYPGTQSFQRWEFPSRLAPTVVTRALDVAKRFLSAVGFGTGFFNMEFFYDAAADRIAVIEFNPRLSSQFGELYRQCLGVDPHAMALAIAQGRLGRSVARQAPSAKIAASLVWRAFDRKEIPPRASQDALRRLQHDMPEANVVQFPRSTFTVQRELSWLESHRYAVVNLGAEDAEALYRRSTQISEALGWPNAPFVQSLSELALSDGDWFARGR